MPVADHPVHEKVKITSDFRYGCHSRNGHVRKCGYMAPDRVYLASDNYGLYANIQAFVADNSSHECRYDQSHKDFACEGCKRREQ